MKSVSINIRRAVLVAMAPACGQAATLVDGGADVSAPPNDATIADVIDDIDAGDDAIDDSAINHPDVPVPPGCILLGKPDGFAPCGYTESLNDPALCQVDVNADGGTQNASLCFALCSWGEPDCYYFSAGDAGDYLTCGMGCVGRLNETARSNLRGACEPLGGDTGDTLARAAYLEAISIDAFVSLASDLHAYGAPTRLVAAAQRAARDETRHARVVGGFARAYGAATKRPRRARRVRRPLAEIALENAIEGCVRETYGAAVALWQSEHASDARFREAMKSIARDELDHATLGWAVHAWACRKLDAKAREKIVRAHERAIDELGASLPSNARASRELGMPDAISARAIYDALRATIWS